MKYLVSTEDKASFKEITFNEGTDTTKEDAPQPESIVSYRLKNSSSKFDKISKMVSFKLDEYNFLAIVRNNYTLQILMVAPSAGSSEIDYYRVLRTIPLEPENNRNGADKIYETTMISLGIHLNEFLYAVTEHGELYLISLKEFQKFATEDTFNETLEIKQQIANREAEKEKSKETAISDIPKTHSKATAPAVPSEPSTLKISRVLSSLEFDDDIDVNFINLNCAKKLYAFTSSNCNFGIFAYGGQEIDLTIINIGSALSTYMKTRKIVNSAAEIIFRGKNVKNDRLDLKVPIWISNIAFLNEVPYDDTADFLAKFQSKDYKFEIITSTYYGEIRRYDTAHGRKPISNHLVFPPPFNAPNKKAKIFCMELLNEKEVVVSDDHNGVVRFDFIKGLSMGKYQGVQGAVHDLRILGKFLAVGGLDKYLRVYNIDSREYYAKIYTGSRISSVLSVAYGENCENVDTESGKDVEEEIDDDDENIWNQLEQESDRDNEPAKKKVRM